MHRHLELDAGVPGPGAPILDVVGEALLPRVEIDGGDPLPDIHQGDGDVHGGGRFARAALLVAEHDDVRGRRPSRARLNQHDATSPWAIPIPRTVRNQGTVAAGLV